jgi:hypothetical protein
MGSIAKVTQSIKVCITFLNIIIRYGRGKRLGYSEKNWGLRIKWKS